MSIKNIIQQENDLQEMSMQSLANYLNNPTGQYNPYLVAGELQRKEAFAQRQTVEAPQETVVDELVAEAMPMGGMPRDRMPQMPQMPQPRPEEMISESITETGISNLPAPNIGQTYASGGIVGYDNGGEVEESSYWDYLDPAIEGASLMAWPVMTGMWPKEMGDSTLYTGEELKNLQEQNTAQNLGLAGAGGVGAVAVKDKLKKKKVKTPKIKPKGRVGTIVAGAGLGLKSLWEAGKKKLTPAKPKKLTKTEKADKVKADKAKAKKDKAAQKKKDALRGTPGAVDRAIIGGGKYVRDVGWAGLKGLGKGMYNNPVASTIGLGLGGLGAGMMYNAAEERKIKEESARLEREAKRLEDEAALAESQAEYNRKRELEIAARDKRREKEAYLALALGGAKTMAGQSPYALTNIGEGLGSGVAALAAYDQNEMERMAASAAATTKAQQDMRIALMDYEMKYYERVNKLADNETYTDALEVLDDKLAEGTLVEADYVLAKEALLREFAGLDPASYGKRINGQQFYAAE